MRAIKTVIPFKPDNPKSRLAPALTEEERKIFVGLSLENVLSVLKESGIKQVDILSKSALDAEDEKRLKTISETGFEITIMIDESDLNTAVNAYLRSSENPVLIVMADLALLTKENIEAMTAPARNTKKTDYIRIAPGKDGGTNMMFIGAPDVFEVNYYGESFKKHKEEAERKNLICEIHESFYAAADMDEPEDLNDILQHGSGKIRDFVNEILIDND
ncbi:2-phospho-L-lactate guanylyltransferase [Methanimicrococcus blatticola]|uniref:2-phospho-L-lactate guanylyltransferase n=1 Tax=Methanimicrococcus blatticola TaxID=91560 RepID=A0A484F585_9EURY|nr:2-phospho-L-lactate guanylyltransferase [Methanimicrococcus blatticola]MBZ3935594.1 2-phospho-L-lactate guanylyltransferase [Methanimicrococcus blatticola]MCC2509235.1 2-phospho-L-lactate guanylyltransferase [Methanimicrococcus blatticola]TDQ69399.1 phospholactate guanylyltransferase [Methanimicrococcus blatticola]